MDINNYSDTNDIAIIGMSGAFPGADTIDEFKENISRGKCGIRELSTDELQDAGVCKETYEQRHYVRMAATLNRVKSFDADFFGYTKSEAAQIDPQHRLFLEHGWAALEHAGYIPDDIESVVGVYGGCSMNRYLLNNVKINTEKFSAVDFQKMIGNDKDFLTTRLSYKLNLSGPSFNVQTACSTSLVATQLAVLSLQTYQCDIALCGGSTINVPHGGGYLYSEGLIFSPNGRCRPFSPKANGTVFGEGVGVVVLKRLAEAVEDGDYIWAVIKGAAVNNDGGYKVGYTSPSVEGQAEVISLAYNLADIEPNQVDYIETHGTGTAMGDEIELAGLHEVFLTAGVEPRSIALGTLKANLGHLDAAAGVASLIKAVIIAHDKIIPPNYGDGEEAPLISQVDSPFYFTSSSVNLQGKEGPVVVGVSSFGLGGTNAHVVIESPPTIEEKEELDTGSQEKLLLFSGKDKDAAKQLQLEVVEHVRGDCLRVEDVAWTLLKCRKAFDNRTFSQSIQTQEGQLQFVDFNKVIVAKDEPSVAFMFPGQGSQYRGMATSLYKTDIVFRGYIDKCLQLLPAITNLDIRGALLDQEGEPLIGTEVTQLTLFVIEYSLGRTFIDYGTVPSVMMGHSVGEYAAACIAGVFSLADALKIVFHRGRLMEETEKGLMTAVFKPREQLEDRLFGSLAISAINGPANVVVSGTEKDIVVFEAGLADEKVRFSRLVTSHAFHSRFMEPVLERFEDVVRKVSLREPKIEIISSTPGCKSRDLGSYRYWVDHIRKEVDFHSALVKGLFEKDVDVALEVGPGSTLCFFAGVSGANSRDLQLVASLPGIKQRGNSRNFFNQALGQLWCAGVAVNLQKAGMVGYGKKTPLPTYPFQGEEYWYSGDRRNATPVLDGKVKSEAGKGTNGNDGGLETVQSKVRNAWIEVFGDEQIPDDVNFFDAGGDSVALVGLASLLSERFEVEVSTATIIQWPTISQLSDALTNFQEESSEMTVTTSLFKVDGRGEQVPLFLIAGAHEDRYYNNASNKSNYEEDAIRYFSSFTKILGGKRAIYGFQPKGLTEGSRMHQSVSHMASAYIEEMKAVQSTGPYLIGGECVGGLVALEMARQLTAKQEDVLFLLLMDTPRPSWWVRTREVSLVKLRRVRRVLRELAETFQKGDRENSRSFLKSSLRGAACYFFPVNKAIRKERVLRFGSQKYLKTLMKYTPSEVKVRGALLINREWWNEKGALGWDNDILPNFKISPVDGDHKTRLTVYGASLGSIVNSMLEELEKD